MFIIRFIIPLLIIGCSSVDEKSFGRVSFDNSFTAEHRFILSTCLSELKQELYLSNLSIETTTENINNLGLEFDSKSILTTNFETLDADEVFGTVEAVKTVSDLFLPVSGEIIEFNEDLEDTPEDVNAEPYSKGWMIKMKVSDPDDLNHLLDSNQYRELIGE